jgi:transposase-like protein
MHSLTPQQLDVIQALSTGLSVTAAADAVGVHRTTVHHWCRTIPDFRYTLEASKQAYIDRVRDEMNTLVDPSLALLKNVLNDESAPMSLRIRTAMAILKFVSTPQKSTQAKGVDAEMDMLDAAYTAGYNSARRQPDPAPEDAIHHNSSLSSSSQTPRNALCPCGSKLKYKRCCGKNAPPVLSRAA